MNESIFMDSARALAGRAVKEGGATDEDRITFAFRCCTSRLPATDERAALLKLLAAQRERIKKGEVDATEIATGNKDPKGPPIALDDVAAFTVVARVLLGLDETITKE